MGLSHQATPLQQDLEVVRYFTKQFGALSDGRILDLLERFETRPFMNAEARAVFGNRRQTTWEKLVRLTDAGLVQKRGHVYRVTPFASEFVRASASVLKHLVTGAEVPAQQVDRGLLQVAMEGVEILYAKGKLSQSQYFEYKRAVSEVPRPV